MNSAEKVIELRPRPQEPVPPYQTDWKACLLVVVLGLAGLGLLFGLIGYFATLVPEAAHSETVRQRAIAAGSWQHMAGYSDYAEFVKQNP